MKPTEEFPPPSPDPSAIATAFTEARKNGAAVPGYPGGSLPPSLTAAYAVQEAAIALWPDRIVGWKIGRIPEPAAARLGADRLMGPIFARSLWQADAAPTRVPVFRGGFAAVEAEFVIRIGRDADPAKTAYTLAEAEAFIGSFHVGVEMAGSPLATINALGPTAVVSDFGNNNGLILGPELPDWQSQPWETLRCETFIEGASVGTGTAADLPGGPISALRFALETGARRSRPLRAGELVSTGAVTGIHDIAADQQAHCTFPGGHEIHCRTEPATR